MSVTSSLNLTKTFCRVARISQRGGGGGGGGGAWKFDTTINEPDQSFIGLELDWGGFSVKIRWKKRWSPKKGGGGGGGGGIFTVFGWASVPKESTILVQTTASPSQFLLPNSDGGAVFIFGAKIGLKSTKNVLFCILFRPMGGLERPSLATLLSVMRVETHHWSYWPLSVVFLINTWK